MKKEIVLMGPLMDSVMKTLTDAYTVHRYYEADNPISMLESVASDVTALVTDGGRGVEKEVLEKLPNVQIVSVFGVGVDAVDLDYCKANNIPVTNTPEVLSDDVADMGVALMLAASRMLAYGDAYARAGRWPKEGAMPLTRRMTGKRVGIFGMGSIGLRLAKRLQAFDMDISYCNRNKRGDADYKYFADLVEMAKYVDYLVVAAAASASTAKIINKTVLEALGADGYLINISRGSLVDESALIDALKNNVICGAGLDVFEKEPHITKDFFAMDNVVLQPHNASGTQETREAMGKLVTDNLACHFSGKPLLTRYV